MNVNKTLGWHGQTQFVRVELVKRCFLTFTGIGRDIEHEYLSSFLSIMPIVVLSGNNIDIFVFFVNDLSYMYRSLSFALLKGRNCIITC